MPFGADMDAYPGEAAGGLALVERKQRTFLGLSWGEVKLLIIAGIGYLMDAYDLFVVNLIYSIVVKVYYPRGTKDLNWGLAGGVFKASANLGNVVGQVLFGYLGDLISRKFVYGKELIIVIVAVILCISAPDYLGEGVTYWIFAFRVLMGIGIGGDYPMSATIVADRAQVNKRGVLLSLIFSNQGWGNLAASIVAVVVIQAYKSAVFDNGNIHKLSGAWRILQGASLVPAFGVLYFRLTMVESTRFTQARALQDNPDLLDQYEKAINTTDNNKQEQQTAGKSSASDPASSLKKDGGDLSSDEDLAHGDAKRVTETLAAEQGFKSDFRQYFSQPKHALLLFGAAFSWFLIDITFYGINLNQTSILTALGYAGDGGYGAAGEPAKAVWTELKNVSIGNLIITVAGFLPGYFISAALIEVVGRKPIQLLGFAMNALFLGILAGKYDTLTHPDHKGPLLAVFVFLQLFFNFGANTTTFIIPAEVFPTRVRGTAHGICAAVGKLGAILASLLFGTLNHNKSFKTANIFWVFFAVSILGFLVTLAFVKETKGYDADEVDRAELLEQREKRRALS